MKRGMKLLANFGLYWVLEPKGWLLANSRMMVYLMSEKLTCLLRRKLLTRADCPNDAPRSCAYPSVLGDALLNP